MKNKANRKVLFILAALCMWSPVKSQQKPDSLYNYLEIAVKNNPTVLQRYYEYEAALQKIPQVGSLPDPDVSFGVFLSPMEIIGGNQVADIRLMQMFPWFGVLNSAKDEMSLMAKAKFESFRDAKLQVYYDVQSTWYEMQKVKQNIGITGKNIEILHTIERLAIVGFGSGSSTVGLSSPNMPATPFPATGSATASSPMNSMGSTSGSVAKQASTSMPNNIMGSTKGNSGLAEVYRIQIEIGQLQNTIEILNNQLNTLAVQFNGYLNRQPDAAVAIPDTLIEDSFQPLLSEMSDSTLFDNPMLGMIQYENQSLEARKNMVSRMGYPMIGLGLNYSVVSSNEMSTSPMNGKDMVMPMVTASLPIYRKKYRAMKSETELLKSANEQNYKSTVISLQTEYYKAMQMYRDSKLRMTLYANQSLLASKSLDIMIKSYAASSSDLTDLLRINQQNLDYKYKQMEAIADINTSIAWLKRIMAVSQ